MIFGDRRPLYRSETFWMVALSVGGPLLAIFTAFVLPALLRWLGLEEGR